MKYTLPQLPYEYNALEPYIDTKTMEIHHTKHHQAYINNLNLVLEKYIGFADEKLESLLEKIDTLKFENEKDKVMLRNHGGGYLNHSFFWSNMSPKKEIDEKLQSEIKKEFGSVVEFKNIFKAEAIGRFGSGWIWLVKDRSNKLLMYSTPNQDSPSLQGHTPLIALDVWEHAYYLKYQNKRDEYIENWWNVLKVI